MSDDREFATPEQLSRYRGTQLYRATFAFFNRDGSTGELIATIDLARSESMPEALISDIVKNAAKGAGYPLLGIFPEPVND